MTRRNGARWYGFLGSWSGSKGRAQIEDRLFRERDTRSTQLPEPILRLAQDEYDRQFPGQPYERMQQRGGLGVLEIIALLADSLERHGVRASNEARDTGGPNDRD